MSCKAPIARDSQRPGFECALHNNEPVARERQETKASKHEYRTRSPGSAGSTTQSIRRRCSWRDEHGYKRRFVADARSFVIVGHRVDDRLISRLGCFARFLADFRAYPIRRAVAPSITRRCSQSGASPTTTRRSTYDTGTHAVLGSSWSTDDRERTRKSDERTRPRHAVKEAESRRRGHGQRARRVYSP